MFLIYTRGFTSFILRCIILSRGEETIRFLVFKLVFSSALRSHFLMFSPMLFLLVKKSGNSVLFGFVLSSEQSEVNN